MAQNGARTKAAEVSWAKLLPLALLLVLTPCAPRAQQAALAATDSLPPAEEEEEFIKPSRPGVANPAEIHKAGVLQLEYGYDGNFRAEEFRKEQTAPLALRLAAASRLLLEAATYKVNRRLILDAGVRVGLNDDAPRFGLFAGLTVGVADFKKQ